MWSKRYFQLVSLILATTQATQAEVPEGVDPEEWRLALAASNASYAQGHALRMAVEAGEQAGSDARQAAARAGIDARQAAARIRVAEEEAVKQAAQDEKDRAAAEIQELRQATRDAADDAVRPAVNAVATAYFTKSPLAAVSACVSFRLNENACAVAVTKARELDEEMIEMSQGDLDYPNRRLHFEIAFSGNYAKYMVEHGEE